MDKTWKQLYEELADLMSETLDYLKDVVGSDSDDSPVIQNMGRRFDCIEDDAARLEAEEHQ